MCATLLENASLSWSELIARKFNPSAEIGRQPAPQLLLPACIAARTGSNLTGTGRANGRLAFISQQRGDIAGSGGQTRAPLLPSGQARTVSVPPTGMALPRNE
jgi:hypothetical protein